MLSRLALLCPDPFASWPRTKKHFRHGVKQASSKALMGRFVGINLRGSGSQYEIPLTIEKLRGACITA